MTNESLLNDIYPEVVKSSKDYCKICFRTSKESLLHDGKSLYVFNYFRYSTNKLDLLDINPAKYENERVCYMCAASATAATKFCIAMNLSHKLHMLFNKMKQQYSFQRLVRDHLTTPHLQRDETPVKYNNHSVLELQTLLQQHRRNTTLLQSETLLLNSPGEVTESCVVERTGATSATGYATLTTIAPTPATGHVTPATGHVTPATGHVTPATGHVTPATGHVTPATGHVTPATGHVTPATCRTSRDRLTFETQSIDERLFHMNDPNIMSSEIVIEDDDPPDDNVFIIPDELPAPAPTDRYILHPIVMNNGTITIPSLDQHMTIKEPNFTETGSSSNAHPPPLQPSLTSFLMNQFPQNNSNTLILSNQNAPKFNFIQNTNSLAQNIVSLVKNQPNTISFVSIAPNWDTLTQSTLNLSQSTSNLSQSTSTFSQSTAKSTQTLHSPSSAPLTVIKKISPAKLAPGPVKATTSAVKVPAAAVKRPDSEFDSDTYCHTKLPIRKEDGKVDWEDKIPMDVISFVSPSDPAMAVKRQKLCSGGFASAVVPPSPEPVDYGDAMDKCVITDVKSVRDEVIDLC